jgi:hypothetical protein
MNPSQAMDGMMEIIHPASGVSELPLVSSVSRQVQANCDISDAVHAGVFSICGLALRMRDLYKWEKQLPPWKEKADEDILDWIGRREETWEGVRDTAYQPVTVSGRTYDAFDTAGINGALAASGLFYGAGYAYSLKPTFFLARVIREQTIDGQRVLHLGEELARDLLTLPAMSRDGVIVLRSEAARMYLWDQIQYLKKSGKPFLEYALDQLGVADQNPETLRRALPALFAAQVETYIRHEVGETKDAVFDRETWQEIIAAYPHTPVELLVRAVKDLLADTSEYGTLPYLINSGQVVSLALYAAFLDGLGRVLFPELRPAFSHFMETGDMDVISRTVNTGYRNARRMVADIIAIYQEGKSGKGKTWAADKITKRYLNNGKDA